MRQKKKRKRRNNSQQIKVSNVQAICGRNTTHICRQVVRNVFQGNQMEYVTNYKKTGICEIDIENVVKDWLRMPHLWLISQYNDEFRLIRFLRKNSELTTLKVTLPYRETQRDGLSAA